MKVDDLISHYREVKSLHGAIPDSLREKIEMVSIVFGSMDVDTSTGPDYVRAAKLHWLGAAPGTIKRYLGQLRAILNRSCRDGLIPRMVVIDMPFVHDTVYVDISGSEVKILLDYIKWTEPKWYPLALVLTNTGARLGEALMLNPSSFTRHGTRISKPVGRRSKTVDRTIPYTARLRAAVEGDTLFRNGSLVPAGIADDSVPVCLGRVIDASVKALGLPPLRVHDLRHAFAAVLAENGADLADLVAALGHSSPAMAMRYRGLIKGRLTGILAAVK
jgi:integrase